jgi:hypothetical protein
VGKIRCVKSRPWTVDIYFIELFKYSECEHLHNSFCRLPAGLLSKFRKLARADIQRSTYWLKQKWVWYGSILSIYIVKHTATARQRPQHTRSAIQGRFILWSVPWPLLGNAQYSLPTIQARCFLCCGAIRVYIKECEMYTWRKVKSIHKRQTHLLVREDVT